MIKKYIKGNKERGAEVIKAIEELGGENLLKYSGEYENSFYYINADNIIDFVQNTSNTGRIIQECFEEIKLPEHNFNVSTKEPKQIYWFRATKDKAKNQALFDKLCDLVGLDSCCIDVSDGIIYFNPSRNVITYCVENHIYSSIECTIAMMVGKELVIEQ